MEMKPSNLSMVVLMLALHLGERADRKGKTETYFAEFYRQYPHCAQHHLFFKILYPEEY